MAEGIRKTPEGKRRAAGLPALGARQLPNPERNPLFLRLHGQAGNAALGSLLSGVPPESRARAADLMRAGDGSNEALVELQRQAGGATTTAPAKTPPTTGGATPALPPIAWINELPPFIQEQIDMYSKEFLSAQPLGKLLAVLGQQMANRVTFMNTMRKLFGSDAAIEAHFREIKPMANAATADQQLWAHVSTRERLLQAQQDLRAQNTPMPQTSVALGLRGDHLHPEGKSAGWFTHATGFAIDWKAHAAPHIKDPSLIALFETVTGGPAHFDLNISIKGRLDLIEKMGQGKAGEAESEALLQRVEAEYNRLVAGSQKFKTDLPETSLAPLREVETARTAVVGAQGTVVRLRRRGAKKADIEAASAALSAALETFDAKVKAAEPLLPQIFEPWTKLLDERIAAIDKAAGDQGVDLAKLTGDYGFKELKTKLATIRGKQMPLRQTASAVLAEVVQIQRDALLIAARLEAAQAWLAAPGQRAPDPTDRATWSVDLDAVKESLEGVSDSLDPIKASLAGLLPGAVLAPKPIPAVRPSAVSSAAVAGFRMAVGRLPDRVTRSADKLKTVLQPLTDLLGQGAGVEQEITERTAYRKQTVDALGGPGKPSRAKGEAAVGALLEQKTRWLALKGAKNGLQTNAEGFVFKAKDVRNPAITQLLGLMSGTRGGGFFTPDPETGGEAEAKKGQWSDTHGFNLAFMKAMVSHGFELGVAWKGEADTMHFELVEGRRLLESGGSRALSSGAELKTLEVLTEILP